MNKVVLIGRLVRDPELKTTSSGIEVATVTIAVDRKYKNANGERESDFIPLVVWRQQARFLSQYFSKGNRIGVVGSIQTRNWEDKDGHNRTTTEVVVDEVEFVESKSDNHAPKKEQQQVQDDDFDTNLPFDL